MMWNSMRLRLPSVVLGLLVVPTAVAIVACSGDDRPPILDVKDASNLYKDVISGEPCQTPTSGCPCEDAGVELYCGVIYRVSGSHVDCAKGYMKCGDDGIWGKCEGPSIYGAE